MFPRATPQVAEAPKSSFPSGFGQQKAPEPTEDAGASPSAAPAAPIFGFGSGSGFGGFAAGATFDPSVFAVPRVPVAATEGDDEDAAAAEAAATADIEAECKAEFTPLVKLEHVEARPYTRPHFFQLST